MASQKALIRSSLLYEYKLGTKAAEAARKICRAFGDDAVSDRAAQKWFQKFSLGDFNLTDEARSERPTVIDKINLKEVIHANSSLTYLELPKKFNVSDETIRVHLHQLGKKWKLSKWVPHDLSESNKISRFPIFSANLSRYKKESFLDRLLTCDEKWLLFSNNKQSCHWLSSTAPIQHTSKNPLHPKKILLCVWWTAAGIIHYEFLESGQTITAAVYCDQLERVKAALIQKQPSLINRKNVLFLQDNARPHIARLTHEKISELGWETLPLQPYSPDISPSDYHLFLSLDNFMRQRQFQTRDGVIDAVRCFFDSKSKDFYKTGIQHLVTRWQNIIKCGGDYFDD